jgi:hypothetical protein
MNTIALPQSMGCVLFLSFVRKLLGTEYGTRYVINTGITAGYD